jgi:hypothetical protein
MPITFDEVSAEIDRQPAPAPATPALAATPVADLREQLAYELDLRAERQARLGAD